MVHYRRNWRHVCTCCQLLHVACSPCNSWQASSRSQLCRSLCKYVHNILSCSQRTIVQLCNDQLVLLSLVFLCMSHYFWGTDRFITHARRVSTSLQAAAQFLPVSALLTLCPSGPGPPPCFSPPTWPTSSVSRDLSGEFPKGLISRKFQNWFQSDFASEIDCCKSCH
jgi:hypothetical protein